MLIVFRQPGANIISTVNGIRAVLPQLEASLPGGTNVSVAIDRTPTVRASLNDTQRTLVIAIALVIAVVFVFLGNARATLIPAVAVPVSIIGTFAAMYLLGFSLDNLSLMALTISTGFVVDDAIVVLENIARHMEDGMGRMQAALLGAREVGFTVLSISTSLVAVFLPILLMGGIVGRLFREFALTLSLAIVVSLVISLTTTPMMCALFLRVQNQQQPRRWFFRHTEAGFARMQRFYERTLAWSLDRALLVIVVLFATIALNVYLFVIVPKGFFPQQDTGALMGMVQADQSTSFQSMRSKLTAIQNIVRRDPAVANVVGFTGGRQTNTARLVRGAEAGVAAQRDRGPGDRAPAPPSRPRRRRAALSAGGAGHTRRRPASQRAVSIHAAGRRRADTVYLGAQADRRAAERPDADRREQRPAAGGPGNRAGDRPQHRRAPGT